MKDFHIRNLKNIKLILENENWIPVTLCQD